MVAANQLQVLGPKIRDSRVRDLLERTADGKSSVSVDIFESSNVADFKALQQCKSGVPFVGLGSLDVST